MAWRLNGQLVETCSCNVMCPCWFGIKDLQIMDQGWCDSALLFRIGEGDSDGVDLGGRMVVMAMGLAAMAETPIMQPLQRIVAVLTTRQEANIQRWAVGKETRPAERSLPLVEGAGAHSTWVMPEFAFSGVRTKESGPLARNKRTVVNRIDTGTAFP